LDERSQVIQHELQNFLNLKQNSFQELLKEHQKVSGLVRAMKTLDLFTSNELNTLHVNGEKALKNLLIQQIQQKLKTLGFSKLMLQQKLQFLLSENILSNVLLAFQHSKRETTKSGISSTSLQHKTLKNAIQLIVSKASSK